MCVEPCGTRGRIFFCIFHEACEIKKCFYICYDRIILLYYINIGIYFFNFHNSVLDSLFTLEWTIKKENLLRCTLDYFCRSFEKQWKHPPLEMERSTKIKPKKVEWVGRFKC